MVDRCLTLHQEDDNMPFAALPKEKDIKLLIFRGTKSALQGSAFRVYVKDVLPFCTLSLQTSLFVQTKQIFQQIHGSASGNQISPVLTDIAVSWMKQQWCEINQEQLCRYADKFFVYRYVDNRLVVFCEQVQQCQWLAQL